MSLQNKALITHNDAVHIENSVRSVLHCDRGGYGGLVEADVYEKHPLDAAIACIIALHTPEKDDRIDPYIDDFIYAWRNATPEQYEENFRADFDGLVDRLKDNANKS